MIDGVNCPGGRIVQRAINWTTRRPWSETHKSKKKGKGRTDASKEKKRGQKFKHAKYKLHN